MHACLKLAGHSTLSLDTLFLDTVVQKTVVFSVLGALKEGPRETYVQDD